MNDRLTRISIFTLMLSFFLVISTTGVLADGTETLGNPVGIQIEQGSGIVVGGTGLEDLSGTISITVPPGTIKQVLLYWSGGAYEPGIGDSQISVNGTPVTGTLIGGPAFFFKYLGNIYFSTYRADITGMGIVKTGPNSITISDMNFYHPGAYSENDGAGILVIYDDGSTSSLIQLRDGIDLAFINFPEPRKSTIPQVFEFPASLIDREANLGMFFGSVSSSNRPNSIEVTVAGITTTYSNLLFSNNGPQWDSLNLAVNIPASATSLTVQAFSRNDTGDGQNPLAASFSWSAAALSVPIPKAPGTGTPGYWINHPEAWPVNSITIGGITYTKDQAIGIMKKPVSGDKTYTMFPALVSAKLNVLSGNQDSCIAATISAADLWMKNNPIGIKVKGSSQAWKVGEPLSIKLDNYNNGLLCAPHRD